MDESLRYNFTEHTQQEPVAEILHELTYSTKYIPSIEMDDFRNRYFIEKRTTYLLYFIELCLRKRIIKKNPINS